jgi:hypothetical protein
VSGYANPITWAHNVNVTGVNRTLATITWKAVSCGVVTTTITAGGTALGGLDPGTTKYPGTINVHPESTGSFSATPYNTTQINLSWVKFTGDDRVVIRYTNSSPPPANINAGILLYNGTGTSTQHTGLSSGNHKYYSIWGYNGTANLYSISHQSDDALVPFPNNPPVFGTPSPTNGSINREYALTWSIPISDPEGDIMNFRISCENGEFTDVAGASNGTKTLSISGLLPSTTYTVWVNATDPAGSGLYTREWYVFTTKANSPPDTPNGGTDPTPVNNAPNVPISIGFLRVEVNDPDDDAMDVDFYWGNGTLIGTDTGVASGDTASIAIPILTYNTTYYWYVEITDTYSAMTRGPTAGNWTYSTPISAPSTPTPGINFHNVYFTVIDDTNNLPISGALLQIYKYYGTENQKLSATGNTGQYGTWSVKIQNFDYTLVVTATGYNQGITTFTVNGYDVYVTIRLTPTVPPAGLAGLTDNNGILTQTGFIVLALAIIFILVAVFIWLDKKQKKRKR